MSIVNCVNNWYFNCVLITINLSDNQLSICDLLIKKSFIMSRSEEWVPFNVACDDKTKILMNSKVNIEAILLLFINSKVHGLIIWGIIFEYSLYFYAFFAVRLSRLVLTSCNLEQYEVDTLLSVWFSQDSARYCWVLLSVILFANQNFLDDFSIGCSVSFCSKTLPLNTSLWKLGWRDSVWEKSSF